MQEFLYLMIQRCAADNYLLKLTSECADEFLAYLRIDESIEERHGKGPSHGAL